ncbi:hypothetical protein C1Y40_05416 [Mycobacterium talmoniae]|uniref:Uncharacterized protein n=1 Tax=Mycobacterium talmoniae TaxID=1858794 RepID=A0A2S8BCN5_9MYCO|nr:hypothetical protein C1Y40_05416 [Mycobacterium talmoniae]
MIFINCRRSSGLSMILLPNALRLRATTMASFRQRRIMAAARAPCEIRHRLTCSIIWANPRPTSPTR